MHNQECRTKVTLQSALAFLGTQSNENSAMKFEGSFHFIAIPPQKQDLGNLFHREYLKILKNFLEVSKMGAEPGVGTPSREL